MYIYTTYQRDTCGAQFQQSCNIYYIYTQRVKQEIIILILRGIPHLGYCLALNVSSLHK